MERKYKIVFRYVGSSEKKKSILSNILNTGLVLGLTCLRERYRMKRKYKIVFRYVDSSEKKKSILFNIPNTGLVLSPICL